MRSVIVITKDRQRNTFEEHSPEADYFAGLRLGDVSDLDGYEGRVVNVQEDYESILVKIA